MTEFDGSELLKLLVTFVALARMRCCGLELTYNSSVNRRDVFTVHAQHERLAKENKFVHQYIIKPRHNIHNT